MKTVRILIFVLALCVAGISLAFSTGDRVWVKDVTSPYYLKIGVVTAVVGEGTPEEVDTVRINTINGTVFVDFSVSQLQAAPNINPKK